MDSTRFMLSPKLINTILDNCFGMRNETYYDTSIYVGLGIEFDETSFTFIKEPVSKFFTVTKEPINFSEPVNGIIRNLDSIEWEKAKENWTTGEEKIKYIGLYYKLSTEESGEESNGLPIDFEESGSYVEAENYELIAVLPLFPEETVLLGERMTLNPNSIMIKLDNR